MPPFVPPVPCTVSCSAVSVPSFFAPARIFWMADGRLPAASCSSLRVRKSLTGAPACFASFAAVTPSMRAPNFAPKPPPMYSQITRTVTRGS